VFEPDSGPRWLAGAGHRTGTRRARPSDLVRIENPCSSSPRKRVRAAMNLGFAGRMRGLT
jgi:hypothetical protein